MPRQPNIVDTASDLSPKTGQPRKPANTAGERNPGYPGREGGLLEEKVYQGGPYPKPGSKPGS